MSVISETAGSTGVAIVGAGIVGLAQVHELLKQGARVALFESQTVCAGQTSHANGGHISADSGVPWMSPLIWRELPHWLFDRHRPFSLDLLRMGWGTWPWLGSALINTTRRRYLANQAALHTLARFSLDVWREYEVDLGRPLIPGRGVLYLYRTRREWEAAQELWSACQACSGRVEVLDAAGCLERVPELRSAMVTPAGGFWYPDDHFGDCQVACERLLEHAVRQGMDLHLGETVKAIESTSGSVTLVTRLGRYRFQKVVIASGVGSGTLARMAGIHLPICPVKGYTRTYAGFPLPCDGPAIADQSRKIVLTPLGSTLRAAGMAEFAGFDDRLDEGFLRRIHDSVSDWLPALRQADSALDWACLRAMTPDGLPILDTDPSGTVVLNVGHGPLGWTLAAGSARVVAQAIGSLGSTTTIDPTPYRLVRKNWAS